jgi:hypothetical protein
MLRTTKKERWVSGGKEGRGKGDTTVDCGDGADEDGGRSIYRSSRSRSEIVEVEVV